MGVQVLSMVAPVYVSVERAVPASRGVRYIEPGVAPVSQ